jgi:hypothetical protein
LLVIPINLMEIKYYAWQLFTEKGIEFSQIIQRETGAHSRRQPGDPGERWAAIA